MAEEIRRVRGQSRSPIRRPAPNPNLNSNIRDSPGSRPSLKKPLVHLNQLETDQLLRTLAQNRENLCTCFDIFQLVLQNGVPQRCITHNNFVTLYCEFDRKLLCVNCIYGNLNHKTHRVIPIKNAFDQISQDNRMMTDELGEAIEKLKIVEKTALESNTITEQSINKLLRNMDEEFQNVKALLTEKYTLTRASVVEMYTQSRTRNDMLLDEIAWLKKTYVDRHKNLPSTSGEEQTQLYTHMLLSALKDSEKIELKMIKELDIDDIRNEVMGELARVREAIENSKSASKARSKVF